MKNIILYLAIFILGIVTALLLINREQQERVAVQETIDEVRDTVDVYPEDMVTTSEPVTKTEYVYVGKTKTDTVIVKDTVYIMMERENFHTSYADIEIWHSGVQSRIDSLKYEKRTSIVTKEVTKNLKNSISIGLEIDYCRSLSLPLEIEYSRKIHKNIAVKGGVYYDFILKDIGVTAGTDITFDW